MVLEEEEEQVAEAAEGSAEAAEAEAEDSAAADSGDGLAHAVKAGNLIIVSALIAEGSYLIN